MIKYWLRVALDVPLLGLFDYYHTEPVAVGVRVLVTFGHRKMIGMVAETPDQPQYDADKVNAVEMVMVDLPPMPADWMAVLPTPLRGGRDASFTCAVA